MIYKEKAKNTLSAIEMDIGDILVFEMMDSTKRTIEILDCNADIIETSNKDTKIEETDGGTSIYFSCDIKFDGHFMIMERYICTQESFYEPYIINGMRIYFDAVKDIFNLIAENHGDCKPRKDVRLAFNDATMAICPDRIHPWCDLCDDTINIGDTYSGDDCWMGPYFGASAHGGLDINHKAGSPLYMPIDIDFSYLFNSLETGDNNNRWRGIRKWDNGDLWIIQVHHLIKMNVPLYVPVSAGVLMADAAGVHVGSHEHSHFVFGIVSNGQKILLDPFILFREMFEGKKEEKHQIKANIIPFGPAKTGHEILFKSGGTRAESTAGI